MPSATAIVPMSCAETTTPPIVVRCSSPNGLCSCCALAAPLPDDEAVDRDEEADRDDHDPQDAAALDRADHDAGGSRRRRRTTSGSVTTNAGPVAPAVVRRSASSAM